MSRTICWAGVCISMVKVCIRSEVILAFRFVVSLGKEFVVLLLIILVTDCFLPFLELSLQLFFRVLPLWLFLFSTLFLFLISASISAPTLTCIHVFQVFFSQSVPFSLSFESLISFLHLLESSFVTSLSNIWVVLFDETQVYCLQLLLILHSLSLCLFLSEYSLCTR